MTDFGSQSSGSAGWHPDPAGRAAQRYWNGSSWTSHVVDFNGQQHDESNWVPAAPQMIMQNSTVVVHTPKSKGVAFLLTFFFGPLGMLYSTVTGAIIMFVLSVVLIPLTLGLAFFVLWPISIIWGVAAVDNNPTAVAVQAFGTGTVQHVARPAPPPAATLPPIVPIAPVEPRSIEAPGVTRPAPADAADSTPWYLDVERDRGTID